MEKKETKPVEKQQPEQEQTLTVTLKVVGNQVQEPVVNPKGAITKGMLIQILEGSKASILNERI